MDRLRRAARHLAPAPPPAATRPAPAARPAPASAPRARDLGIPFGGDAPGPTNSLVDVPGVAVGHSTVIHGEGAEAVRTGVTAVLPRGKEAEGSCYGGCKRPTLPSFVPACPLLSASAARQGSR